MVINTTPRRLHLAMNSNDSTITKGQPSPISMRYSVTCAKSSILQHEAISHHSTETLNHEAKQVVDQTASVKWNIGLLTAMSISSALFSMLSLHFYFMSNDRLRGKPGVYRNYVDVLKDVVHCFDLAIVICSIATFFISSLQLLFFMKMMKLQNQNADIPLQYIQNTSFLRIVTYSFWYASIVLFITVTLITCAIDPSRSLASKCVSITLGVSAVLLCIWFSIRTLHFWSRLAYGHVYTDNYYNHLSTLV
ncbi:unnamed protein product [Caenorhabditis bovis]|uniref:Uncharacterized protein n=1 Tax=Caenorhabditis bovis TaxID=2654633 RepID=A0A8S1F4A1_9PELO|nr:unnamed protein product [Caenorhabditis bovis]